MAIFALIGSLACGTVAELPATSLLLALLVMATAVACVPRSGWLRLAAAAAIGFAWTALAATGAVADRLAQSRWNEERVVIVRVSAFPVVRPGLTRFEAQPVDLTAVPKRLRLSCYRCPIKIALGDTWSLTAAASTATRIRQSGDIRLRTLADASRGRCYGLYRGSGRR